MCCKNGAKTFYVLFQSVKPTQAVSIIANHEYVYKSLEVFKTFPTSHEIANTIVKHKVEDLYSLKAMKIEIPYSRF